ncbi:MAG: cation-translocating P-type ATPase, partial [Actinomycetia bacterium]|nr:cation-translocating P-type ATPase [Actinomycetes bacterium]
MSECLRVLDVDGESGLSSAEVTARRSEFGRNEFAEDPPEPAWRAFLEQYRGFMQLMLLGAAIVSFTIGQVSTGVLLIGLTVMNAFLGYRQEAEAEEALESLRQMMSVATRVRRDGALVEVPAEDLVPGDVVQLEAGDLVPADGRLMQAASLEVEESALTGESQPVGKSSSAVDVADMPLGDRFSVAYMNTLVSRGTATMVVTSTGMSTEMGRIAGMLAGVERSRSPLQQQMDDLAKVFGVLAGFALVVMVGIGLARGLEREALLLLAVSVAVGAIPTGLPTLVTTLLSLATQELAKLGAIVKSLTAVETLGSTTAICSDKTGTLTLNQMTARVLAFDGNTYRIEGEGYSTEGAILRTGGERNLDLDPLLIAMILASDATAGAGAIVGDPTEGALVVLAAKGGLATDTTRAAYPRLAEVPFDAAYKFMATFHQWTTSNGRAVIRCFVKGAPDVLLARASEIQWNGRTQPIDTVRDRVTAGIEELGSQGMRALSFAQRDFDPSMFDPGEDLLALVSDLTVTGFVGIVDPPRPEARTAIARAGDAGIRVRMITGDHLATASAIATELDIEGAAIDGVELDSMSDDELAERIGGLGVFGRVVPEHKVRLVNALKAEGQVTAMTGDGVNDAPALKSADIGVAMGITGTEASKQAATMILTDDNLDTIVRAVEQGRIIYDNLMKYIRFQTSSLVAFIATFVAAAVFNIASGAPLTPLQILFVNFAVTAPPAIALGRDRASPGIMQRPPRKPGTKIISQARALRVTLIGLTMAAATLTAFALGPNDFTANTATVAGTMGFVTLSLAHVAAAIANRFELTTSFGPELLSNPRLLRGLGLSIVATVLATELRFLQRWLPTVSLTAAQWGICILAATTVLVVDEGRKIIEQRRT